MGKENYVRIRGSYEIEAKKYSERKLELPSW